MTTKRNGEGLPSGWCMTLYHDGCKDFYMKQSYAEDRPCTCSCHTTTKVDKKSTKK